MDDKELWEDYAEKYNHLVNLMQEAGINPELLVEVIKAAVKLNNGT